ncbi:hypothetical protein BC826DRAFT_967733 [Russula brevipes]|nr:hypothetical protein BC826DRAFT_967733 [Russula brevipes]
MAWMSSPSSAGERHGRADGGAEEGASGQMSSSVRRGGGGAMAGSSEAGVHCVAGLVSHSDSASREMALRRCLRARDATKADEGKDEDAEEEEDEEAKELEEAMGCGFGDAAVRTGVNVESGGERERERGRDAHRRSEQLRKGASTWNQERKRQVTVEMGERTSWRPESADDQRDRVVAAAQSDL